MRRSGEGSVTQIAEGKYRIRGPLQADGTRASLGYSSTLGDAQRIASGQILAKPLSPALLSRTFHEIAQTVLDEREVSGIRDVRKELLRYKLHLATAHFAHLPVSEIRPKDIARWLRDMSRKKAKDHREARLISAHTVQRILTLASVIFQECGPQGRGLIETNPCAGLKLRENKGTKTHEPWTFLTLAEQSAIEESPNICPGHKLPILFAIWSGLRQGEQFNLELPDLIVEGDNPRVVVRFGSPGRAPKSGKIRTVPLFGHSLRAAREWLAMRPDHRGQLAVWTDPHGGRRGIGRPLGSQLRNDHEGGPKGQRVDVFRSCLLSAGITRRVRWHDLRHTCASSLVGGLWGQAWSLSEVRDMLGQSSVSVTERYAHLGTTALRTAAGRMREITARLDKDLSVELATVVGPTPEGLHERLNKREIVPSD